MNQSQRSAIVSFIWSIADDVLRDVSQPLLRGPLPLEEIRADILALQKETQGLPDEILSGGTL